VFVGDRFGIGSKGASNLVGILEAFWSFSELFQEPIKIFIDCNFPPQSV
jgi:hypothetical protein